MKIFQLCLFVALLIINSACANKNAQLSGEVSKYTIDYPSLTKKTLNDYWKICNNIEYILLKDSSEKALFGRTDKIKVRNNQIYIADKRMRTLAVYNIDGNALGTVGERGQGPAEYVNLTDFDVDSLGNICILDGRLDKVLFYDSDFQFISEKQLPFEADIVQFLDEGRLMYGLSSWNHGKNEGDKIVITDMNMNVLNSLFQYDKYIDPTYWISDYQFADAGDNISYNQTINNDVYIFTRHGELRETIRFDFKDENVPEADKIDIESKINNFDNYSMIRRILAVTDECIIGIMWEHRKKKIFIIDRNEDICYLGDEVKVLDSNFLCGFCDRGIISNIVETDESYPDSVNKHIESEKSVLRIQSIK